MDVRQNKFLRVLPTVILTPVIEPVIVQLEEAFEKANHIAFVTSGKRTESHQLRIIRDYALQYGIHKEFPDGMTCDVNDKYTFEGKQVYVWQPMLCRLHTKGLIINPPISCVALFDYPYFGRNLKGLMLPVSNHIPGNAFDIDGGSNGIKDETEILEKAIKEGRVKGIINIVPERNNNCLHSNCKLV